MKFTILYDQNSNFAKLWENENKTSKFDAQTVKVENIQNYDALLFVFKIKNDSSSCIHSFIPKFLFGSQGNVNSTRYDSAHYTITRAITVKEETNEIIFANASQNGTDNNAFLIPCIIYGIKVS